MEIKSYYEPESGTWTHLLADSRDKIAAIIDPVWVFDPLSGLADTSFIENVLAVAKQAGYRIEWVMETPGHTGDSVSYLAEDTAFIGDTLFAPAFGTARCDFPGGDAAQLYDSIRKLYELPEETRLFLCHDYPQG